MDIDLTPKTKMQVNIMGMLNEFSRPGYGSDNLIGKLYMTPSAAFPIRTENGLWGGNATWDGYNNPVALAQGRGYSKGHTLGCGRYELKTGFVFYHERFRSLFSYGI